jgi:hypothetical protein
MNSIAPANYLLISLKSLGCEVFLISDVPHLDANVIQAGSVDISEILAEQDFQPDLLLFVEGGEMGLFPINFRHLNFPKYWWGIDTHNDYKKHLRISRLFDHSFVAQQDFVEYLRRDGVKSVSWLPLAFPEKESTLGSRNIDLSYVGSTDWDLYPERGDLLSAILINQSNCFVGTAEPEHMFEIYEKSKIVFNYSPKNDLNMRFFEAMGSGALLITNRIIDNGLNEIFIEGEDFVIYSNVEDLVSKLRYLLSKPIVLNRIARNGMLKVKSKHTYKHRAENILDLRVQVGSDTLVDSGDFALALLSLGLYSDSISSYLSSLRGVSSGRRNRIILKFYGPLLTSIVIGAKFFEHVARRIKRRS